MNHSLPRYIFSLSLALMATAAFAADVKIGALSDKHCNPDDYNSHVYAAAGENQCVMTFPEKAKDGSEIESESEAVMNIDGKLVRLRKKPGTSSNEYESAENDIHAVLNVKEVNTSCVEGEDKCCGSDYAGTLAVRTPQGRASVKVAYYRGG